MLGDAHRSRLYVTIDSRSDPSLHDVRYHAPAHQADCPVTGAECLFYGRAFSLDAIVATRRRSSPDDPGWWSQTGSNRRPPACKAGALPTELWPRTGTHAPRRPEPRTRESLVGLGRLELPTSRLSSARSNQLSYKPPTRGAYLRAPAQRRMHRTSAAPGACSSAKKEKRRRRNPANGAQQS